MGRRGGGAMRVEEAVQTLRCFCTPGCLPMRYCGHGKSRAQSLGTEKTYERRYFCLDAAALHAPSCLVYSFGIDKHWGWEAGLTKRFENCNVHAFDPTRNPRRLLGPRITFRSIGLASGTSHDGRNAKGYAQISKSALKSLDEVRSTLGHAARPLSVLMLDCEGCEWGVIETVACAPRVDGLTDVEQIIAEFHFGVDTGIAGDEDLLTAGRALQCLERGWAMTSYKHAGQRRGATFAPGVLRALPDPTTLVMASFRRLGASEPDYETVQETVRDSGGEWEVALRRFQSLKRLNEV